MSEHPLQNGPEAYAHPVRDVMSRRADANQPAPNQPGIVEQDFRMQGMGRRSKRTRYGKKLLGVAVPVVCGLTAATSHAQSASTWNKRGEQAEARDDFDAAFEAFRQAHLKKPTDLRYKTRYERLKFEAANQHLDRGRVLRQSGDTAGATNEFARALQIDPGNEAAAQELQLVEKPAVGPVGGSSAIAPALSPDAQATMASQGTAGVPLSPRTGEQMPQQDRVAADIASIGAPITLKPISDDPITLNTVADSKDIYQAVGKAAGLNVIFDPDYQSKRIPVNLVNISLSDALRIIGTSAKSFWKPVTSNTIFVANNGRQQHQDYDDLAVQTFYLNNVNQQNDANEILVALRNLLSTQVKLYLVTSQNAIVLKASPAELVLAEKIINDLDRVRSEVIMDVAVLEVSRNKERDLGITLPQSFGLTPQYSNANTSSSSSTTSTTSTTGLTLNSLGNLNATNFAVSITGGQVNALLNDADTRILQNPRIRATDGQRSTLKIGSKIPVATGSYNAGVSTGIASIGVQTQFTYLDVGVNVDVTPIVHYDREISLKLKVEISQQNGSETISGVTEPIISQRVAEQQIQLKDGEPSLLAGLFQQQDTNSTSGTPGLGEIPLLKYFFSSQDKIRNRDEIVFLLIPHIVRESLLNDENTRAIFTGTNDNIELIRRDPSQMLAAAAAAQQAAAMRQQQAAAASNTTSSNAASSMIQQIADQNHPLQPGSVTPSSAAVNASAMAAAPGSVNAPISFAVAAPPMAVATGSTFTVAVNASNAHDLSSVPLEMQFDPKVLQLVDVQGGAPGNPRGDLLGGDGQAVALVHRDEGNGAVTITASRPGTVAGVNGSGTLVTLTFKAVAPGDSTLALVRIGARDSRNANLPAVGMQGVVHVK